LSSISCISLVFPHLHENELDAFTNISQASLY
jgi:hypothetical protein